MENIISNETLVAISKSIVDYLRDRLIFTQRLRATYPPEKLIDIDKYAEQYLDLENKVDAIDDLDSAERTELNSQRLRFLKHYNDGVIISERKIEELLNLVEYSIINYGLGLDCAENDNFFISSSLWRIEKTEVRSEEILEALSYWRNINRGVIVSEVLSGRVSIGFRSLVEISNHDYSKIFEFKEDGTEKRYHGANDVDFLIANDCFVGRFYENGKKPIITIFLKKTIGSEEYGKAIIYGNQILPMGEITEACSFNDYCKDKGVDDLCKSFYRNSDEILAIVDAIKRLDSLDRESISELAEVAANWWVNVTVRPIFDNGDTSDVGKNITFIASMYADLLASTHNPQMIDSFRCVLMRKIRAGLILKGFCQLNVDYDPCPELREAADEAGMPVQFPFKTFMQIDMKSIHVYTAQINEIIFKI